MLRYQWQRGVNSKEVVLLGITIDEKLTFNNHIGKITKKPTITQGL